MKRPSGRPKGSKQSMEARAKMRAAKLGIPHSEERKRKISEANKGRKVEKKHERKCPCGIVFMTASAAAKYCSVRCRRAARGHGRRHAPEYMKFAQKCAICSAVEKLVGDHCHTTGRPRGILCRSCNLAIGNMFDSPALLRAAADYLESV